VYDAEEHRIKRDFVEGKSKLNYNELVEEIERIRDEAEDARIRQDFGEENNNNTNFQGLK